MALQGMRDNQTLDAMLGTMASQGAGDVPPDFMNGVWQRAGQLGEIADQRRRMALFAAESLWSVSLYGMITTPMSENQALGVV